MGGSGRAEARARLLLATAPAMPELPEVEAARRLVERNCLGKTITEAQVAEDESESMSGHRPGAGAADGDNSSLRLLQEAALLMLVSVHPSAPAPYLASPQR